MLLRILTMRVDPAKVEAWMRFTRDTGFPGMLAQPGCRQIWRLRAHDVPPAGKTTADFQVMTLWDSQADLEHFRASDDMRRLIEAAAPFMAAPGSEQLFDVIPDPAD
jgi:quinol monooxygenase YgiN